MLAQAQPEENTPPEIQAVSRGGKLLQEAVEATLKLLGTAPLIPIDENLAGFGS